MKTSADIERGVLAQIQGERMARGWDVATAARYFRMKTSDYEAVEAGTRALTLVEFVGCCMALQTHPRFLFGSFKDSDFGGQDGKPGTTLHEEPRTLAK
jgi:hypothetical protein